MFDEMRSVGLPEPVFYRNNFMLQTVVKNKSSDSDSINDNQTRKVAIDEQKVAIGSKKVAIDFIHAKCREADLSSIMTGSILEIYHYLEPNQVFGRTDISKYLDYSYANAGKIITAMKTANLIEEVKGKGKGKYIFRTENVVNKKE